MSDYLAGYEKVMKVAKLGLGGQITDIGYGISNKIVGKLPKSM